MGTKFKHCRKAVPLSGKQLLTTGLSVLTFLSSLVSQSPLPTACKRNGDNAQLGTSPGTRDDLPSIAGLNYAFYSLHCFYWRAAGEGTAFIVRHCDEETWFWADQEEPLEKAVLLQGHLHSHPNLHPEGGWGLRVSPPIYPFFAHFLFFFSADPDILNGVYMSEALNPVFVDNFERDPTLTWQYFGSSTGFFRLYPGKSTAISPSLSAQSRMEQSCVRAQDGDSMSSWRTRCGEPKVSLLP